MTTARRHPIGTPGTPWGEAERAHWRAGLTKQRSYRADVLSALTPLAERFDVVEHGSLSCGPDGDFPLMAIRTRGWDAGRPTMLVTGGVHGYETSGVHGALQSSRDTGTTSRGRRTCSSCPA